MPTIKNINLRKSTDVSNLGFLEIENSLGSNDCICLNEGMRLDQAGHLLIALGHRLLKLEQEDHAETEIKEFNRTQVDFPEGMGEIFDKLRKDKLLPPIRVSRGHMGDLEAASLNCGNEAIRARFEELKINPGFEVIDNPKPGEFLQDLSIMFMYPNEIKPLNTSTTDTRCKACREKVKDWNGGDAKCGFTNGFFDASNNWRCETVRQIRKLVERFGGLLPGLTYTQIDDQQYSTIPVSGIKEFWSDEYPTPLCLWVGWYKNRGRTEGMWLMYENAAPRPPTEAECLLIIKKYQEHLNKMETE